MQPLGLCASLRGRIGNKTFGETRAMCVVFRRFTVLKIKFYHWCGSPGAYTSINIDSRTAGTFCISINHALVCCARKMQQAIFFYCYHINI